MSQVADIRQMYTAIAFEPASMRVLFNVSDGQPELPRLEVASNQRVAHGLCQALRLMSGTNTLLLSTETTDGTCYSFHECQSSMSHEHDGFAWLSFVECKTLLPFFIRERFQILGDYAPSDQGRFGRYGWLSHLLRRLAPDGVLTLEHWNGGINFCLLKLITVDGSFWFKAVGWPNVQEYENTVTLTQLFPEYLPEIVCQLPEWLGWVSRDVQGTTLSTLQDIGAFKATVAALARLQLNSVRKVPMLLNAGMAHMSTTVAITELDDFFDEIGHAMADQTSVKVAPLSRETLRILQMASLQMLLRFAASDLPECLVHADAGHGNIIMTSSGPKFLDWCEAWIAHPFLCAEYLFADMFHSSPSLRDYEEDLRSHYFAFWDGYGSAEKRNWEREFAPPFAALMFAIAIWKKGRSHADRKRQWPLLRSLMRTVNRTLMNLTEAQA